MDVLRGWRLLQAAGLNAEEKRDILSTTKNSLDYTVISAALQSLWDDQLLGRGHLGPPTAYAAHHMDHLWEDQLYYQDMDDWSCQDGGWWHDSYLADSYDQESWMDEDWTEPFQASALEPEDPELMAKLQEAQQAEKAAESLAMEASRTWTEAQRATQALRRDRGFGEVASGSNGVKCFNCGGSHYARDCPDRRHPGLKGNPKGFGKGKFKGYLTEYDDYYGNFANKGKGKNKSKSKKGFALEAQTLWGKGKGYNKGKSVGKERAVNAYANDIFIGGLEVSDAMEATTADHSEGLPQAGMIDCGATASAAPEAVVKGLISAVLTQDKGAKIEFEQSARPYFRFGNGRWGRALCRVHISSIVSGQHRYFSLYTLPNPDRYCHNQSDSSSLVPVLIGMDFLGPSGVGMMIDFSAGLAMNTKETSPEIYELSSNRKGHYVLDLVQYLTKGFSCHEGQAHVVVRSAATSASSPSEHLVLELGTAWFDMTAHDAELDEQELQRARDRMWQLYAASRTTSSTSTAFPAQMPGTSSAGVPPTTSSTCRNGCLDSERTSHRSGDGADLGGGSQGQSQTEGETSVVRPGAPHEGRSSRPQSSSESVAMFRETPPRTSGSQPVGSMDSLPAMQPSPPVHAQEGISIKHHGHSQRCHGESHAWRVTPDAGRDDADGQVTAEAVLQKSVRELLSQSHNYATSTTSPRTSAWGVVGDEEELVAAYENEAQGDL